MTSSERFQLHYNGLTSFVPPCFCWDLVGESGEIRRASALTLANGSRFSAQQLLSLQERDHLVSGYFTPNTNPDGGVTFNVIAIVHPSMEK
jgi:hypothetical protein